MTDKVQKIREEVEKLHGNPYYMIAVKDVLAIIDSLQEESVPKIFEDMLNAKTPAESLGISAEEHEKIIDLCLYGKEPEMVDIDDLPKEEPVSEDLEEAMQHNAPDNIGIDDLLYWRNGFITGAKWGRNQAMAEIQTQSMALAYGCPKELESEDLEEVARWYADSIQMQIDLFKNNINKKAGIQEEDVYMAFRNGAKWKKEQMMKSVLASQEMTCIQVAHRLIGGSWNLACPTDKIGLKSNDKVKVIIIKDE